MSVNIEVDGKSLRLRWTCKKKRYSLYLGLKDSPDNRVKAKKIARTIELDIESGKFDITLNKYRPKTGFIEREDLTCLKLFQKWLDFKSNFIDVRTIEWYNLTLAKLGDLKDASVDDIAYSEVFQFFSKLKDEGLAAETVKRHLENVRACWEWGIKRDLIIDINPWSELVPLVKVPALSAPQPFTESEVKLILEGFKEFYPELLPLIRFLFGTGCRTGEGRGLLWSCLDEECVNCEINGQLSRLGQRKSTKTGKNRTLTLPDSLQEMFLEMRRSRRQSSGYVFVLRGEPIDDYALRHRWERVLFKKAIAYRKPYNTRSTFISHALKKGSDPATVASQVGHSVRVLYEHYAGSINSRPKLPEIF